MTDVRTKNKTEKYTRYGEKQRRRWKERGREKYAKKKRVRASEEIQTHAGRLRRATTMEIIESFGLPFLKVHSHSVQRMSLERWTIKLRLDSGR